MAVFCHEFCRVQGGSSRRWSCCCCCVLCIVFMRSLLVDAFQEHSRSSIGFNKAPVKSFESPDGDIIDCVSIHKQPAFDHPLLRGTKLQRFPSNASWNSDSLFTLERRIQQLWHEAGQRCPSETIPIRRTLDSDIRRHKKSSSRRYGTKARGPPQARPLSNMIPGSRQHEHAIAYVEDGAFYGVEAVINVWSPFVEVPDEFSLSQVWVLSGRFELDLNSVEAGWQVNPVLYGDMNPRFFTYWTSDAYRLTGCYNLNCQGFVQVSDAVVLGGTIAPSSVTSSAQYDIRILIFKDFETGNWWLRYGDELIGYWPGVLFTHLSTFATVIEWGGEIINSQPDNRHTRTQMGSGNFAREGFAHASYLRDLKIVDFTSSLRAPANIRTFATRPSCYDIQSLSGSFFFGGPGLCSTCS